VQKPMMYQVFIDELVPVCLQGHGQIGARRAVDGVWNEEATPDFLPDHHAISVSLSSLTASQRHGFIKKERTTPKPDLDLARQRLKRLRSNS
jgi:hypothetical protein